VRLNVSSSDQKWSIFFHFDLEQVLGTIHPWKRDKLSKESCSVYEARSSYSFCTAIKKENSIGHPFLGV